MMKKQFSGVLVSAFAGSVTLLATQTIATQTTQKENLVVDQYLIIDLNSVSLDKMKTTEAMETFPYYLDLSSEFIDRNVAHIASLDEIVLEGDNENSVDLASTMYAITDIRMEGAVIAQLLCQRADFNDYNAVDFCEVTTLQRPNENGNYELLLQIEDGADVIHYNMVYSEFQKVGITSFYNEYGNAASCLETATNHWLVVHLFSASDQVESTASQPIIKEMHSSDSQEGKKVEENFTNDKSDSINNSEAVPATAAFPKIETISPSTIATTTAAHSHTWVAVNTTVHHDAVTSQVWKEDQAAWDETVVTKEAWDEQVLVQAAWDEPVYVWCAVCNVCGYQYPLTATGDDIDHHALVDPGDGGGWHDIPIQTDTIHHDAVYNTIHHDAEITVVHHDAIGHYETVIKQDAWDETVITGYICSECGAIQ